MSRYPYIMAALMEERWAIEQSKLQIILDFMGDQDAGLKYDPEEIAARRGSAAPGRASDSNNGIAIIPLRGVISNRMSMMDDISGGTSSEGFGNAFLSLVNSPDVKAIVIDVDSPGGAVSGTDELSSLIYRSRGKKPIVAQVNASAASAAYWIATAADEIVVTPSGSVGSIGVLMVHDDISGALEKAGVRKTIIKAGDFKTDGNPYAALPDTVRARMQARIDDAYDMFVTAVARNRGVDAGAVRSGFGRGDMVGANQAVATGMADRVGTLQDTLDRLTRSNFAVKQRPRAAAPSRDRLKAELASEAKGYAEQRRKQFEMLRASLEEPPILFTLSGLATAYNQVGCGSVGLLEYVPGCFGGLDGVCLLLDHDYNTNFGGNGRMSLANTSAGVWLEYAIRADKGGLAAVEAYLSGYTLMSVGCKLQSFDVVSRSEGKTKRVTSAKLGEVSLVRVAAFRGTAATLMPVGGLTMEQAFSQLRREARLSA